MDQTEVVNRRLELQGGHGIRHRGHPLDTSRDVAIRRALPSTCSPRLVTTA